MEAPPPGCPFSISDWNRDRDNTARDLKEFARNRESLAERRLSVAF